MAEEAEVEVEAAEQQQLNTETESGEVPDNQSDEASYSWPVINYDLSPYRTHHFFNQFRTTSNPNNFFKGVKWYIDISTHADRNTFV